MSTTKANRRILVIDDNHAIHEDFRKILGGKSSANSSLDQAEASLFGESDAAKDSAEAEACALISAYQGEEAWEKVKAAQAAGEPYWMAFLDVRMPPGWDGVETAAKLWEVDPDLQIVLCTAYSDYSWDEMLQKLGRSDRLIILKKPFDNIEVFQLAQAVTEKWRLLQESKAQLRTLERTVQERTASLQQTNGALEAEVEEHKRTEAELVKAKAAAEAGSRAKSEFLANMSHEIRTPLNGILGMARLLVDTELTDEQRDFAETVSHSGETLLTILNDILDFSKIEAGKLTLEKIDFELRDLVEKTAELHAPNAQNKGVELIANLNDNDALVLRGDPCRLRQILLNLVGNAVKFTAQGEVVVEVTKVNESEAHAEMRFTVKDSGIGIAPEVLPKLFQSFSQADGSTTRKFGGTGLGLAICKKLVEMMGGQIGATSVPGQGTTFWVTLRLDKSSASALAPMASGLENTRVLVVDDNATNRKVLHHQLLRWQTQNDCVSSGAEALTALAKEASSAHPYDLVILDMQMPEMDGLELARRIKADPAFAKLPLVMLTSLGEHLSAAECKARGLAACLVKPAKQAPLYRTLLDAVSDARGKPRTATNKTSANAASTDPNRPKPGTGLHVLLAEDERVNQKLSLKLLEKLGFTVDLANNGREAVEAAQRRFYPIILMDCLMPEMNGFEATRAIRDAADLTDGKRQPRIIALTANAMQGDREQCLAAGMDDYLSKPIRREIFDELLGRTVALLSNESAAAA